MILRGNSCLKCKVYDVIFVAEDLFDHQKFWSKTISQLEVRKYQEFLNWVLRVTHQKQNPSETNVIIHCIHNSSSKRNHSRHSDTSKCRSQSHPYNYNPNKNYLNHSYKSFNISYKVIISFSQVREENKNLIHDEIKYFAWKFLLLLWNMWYIFHLNFPLASSFLISFAFSLV